MWISRFANGHIQATGRDAEGQAVPISSGVPRSARKTKKYEHMMAFAATLPGIRAAVNEHMGLRGLPREKVLATVAHLLETTLIRVGNDDYARANGSFG